jgi:hypothetical protein
VPISCLLLFEIKRVNSSTDAKARGRAALYVSVLLQACVHLIVCLTHVCCSRRHCKSSTPLLVCMQAATGWDSMYARRGLLCHWPCAAHRAAWLSCRAVK